MYKIVGKITEHIERLLEVEIAEDRCIYVSPSNLEHMRTSHPAVWKKYGAELINILAYPDYVGLRPTDGSIEYVKEFVVDGDYVKVAVRLSDGDRYYARSLYILNGSKIQSYIEKGTIKKT